MSKLLLAWVVTFVAIPLCAIWSINTLFPVANIEYNLHTWFAVLFFTVIFKPVSK